MHAVSSHNSVVIESGPSALVNSILLSSNIVTQSLPTDQTYLPLVLHRVRILSLAHPWAVDVIPKAAME